MITVEQIQSKLAKAIKYSGLTQTEIGKRLNISQTTVSKYMTGRALPSLDMLVNLCRVVGVSPNEILCYDD